MQPDSLVVSIGMANALEAAGWKQGTSFYREHRCEWVEYITSKVRGANISELQIDVPTAEEVLRQLPNGIVIEKYEGRWNVKSDHHPETIFSDPSLADAAAKLYCHIGSLRRE